MRNFPWFYRVSTTLFPARWVCARSHEEAVGKYLAWAVAQPNTEQLLLEQTVMVWGLFHTYMATMRMRGAFFAKA